MEEKKSGAGFLKVVGILMIIFGAIALVVSLIAVAGMSVIEAAIGSEIDTGMLWIGVILSVVSAAMEMVAGIVGVVNAKKSCLPLAILLHMLADTAPALYQRGAMPLWSVEVWLALWTAITMFIAVRLYREMTGGAVKTERS